MKKFKQVILYLTDVSILDSDLPQGSRFRCHLKIGANHSIYRPKFSANLQQEKVTRVGPQPISINNLHPPLELMIAPNKPGNEENNEVICTRWRRKVRRLLRERRKKNHFMALSATFSTESESKKPTRKQTLLI